MIIIEKKIIKFKPHFLIHEVFLKFKYYFSVLSRPQGDKDCGGLKNFVCSIFCHLPDHQAQKQCAKVKFISVHH